METIAVILFGLIFGSFLNVVIYRVPIGKSVVTPGSFCTKCGKHVRFFDNIPVLSYIFLKGRCRYCKAKISIMYPLIELFTSFTFYLTWISFSESILYTVFSLIFLCLMIALSIIDLKHMILPDEMTVGGSILFFIFSFFNPTVRTVDALLTGSAAFLLFWGIYFFYLKVRKIEGLGQGDIKMVLLLGLFLGVNKFIVAVLIASLSGLIVGVFIILTRKKNFQYALPFGTFLGLGSYISLFWGNYLLGKILLLY